MIIKVKWRDIWFGKRHTPLACPIARALNRQTGEKYSVSSINFKRFPSRSKSGGSSHPLPLSVRAFVYAFDHKERGVRPIQFEIPDNQL